MILSSLSSARDHPLHDPIIGHELFVGQRDAGDGHNEDDNAGDGAGGQMRPEQDGSNRLHTVNLENWSQLPNQLIADQIGRSRSKWVSIDLTGEHS